MNFLPSLRFTLLLICICGLTLCVYAQEDNGIQFFEGNLEEALAKAKAENKLVFVDAYAIWCRPCKLMEKNVFSDPEVGAFFNANFVNMKIDQEVGDGRTFARKYRVMSYPTLLFLKPDGKTAHKKMGYMEITDLLDLGKTVVDSN